MASEGRKYLMIFLIGTLIGTLFITLVTMGIISFNSGCSFGVPLDFQCFLSVFSEWFLLVLGLAFLVCLLFFGIVTFCAYVD